jgi:hypothetical protein
MSHPAPDTRFLALVNILTVSCCDSSKYYLRCRKGYGRHTAADSGSLASCFSGGTFTRAAGPFDTGVPWGRCPQTPSICRFGPIAWPQTRRRASSPVSRHKASPRECSAHIMFMPLVQSGKCPKRGRRPAAPPAINTRRPPLYSDRTAESPFRKKQERFCAASHKPLQYDKV